MRNSLRIMRYYYVTVMSCKDSLEKQKNLQNLYSELLLTLFLLGKLFAGLEHI